MLRSQKTRSLSIFLQDKFDLCSQLRQRILPPKTHVDLNTFGSLVLELYKVTKEERYKELGLIYADTQWEVPANAKPKEKEWADKGL